MSEQKFRVESDLLGELKVPADAYYGVQTQRALENYKISTTHMLDYPEYIIAIAYVKMAAAEANARLGVLDRKIADAIVAACKEIVSGKLHDQFPVDMMQGGAGTSVNMNANEVIANRALELMGHKKGEYQFCSPNDHVNCAQSTNDAYPTAFRYTFVRMDRIIVRQAGAPGERKAGDGVGPVIRIGDQPVRHIQPAEVTVSAGFTVNLQVVPGAVGLVPLAVDPDDRPFMGAAGRGCARDSEGTQQQHEPPGIPGALGQARVQAGISEGGAVIPGGQVPAVINQVYVDEELLFKLIRSGGDGAPQVVHDSMDVRAYFFVFRLGQPVSRLQ